MKKTIIATLMINILMVALSTNTNAQSHQNAFSLSHRPPMELKGGSWTINSTKYTALNCIGDPDKSHEGIGAVDTTAFNMLTCLFYSFPTASGTYKIINAGENGTPTANGQIQIGGVIAKTGVLFSSLAEGTAQVTLLAGGKLEVKATNVKIYNIQAPSTTYTLSFDITEQ